MDYFRNQYAKVCWKNSSSSYFYVDRGVRQGGILSPFLFKVYIDDLIQEISFMSCGCTLGLSRINILCYADDIVLIAESKADMNELYKKLKASINFLKLDINKSKTKCMKFGNYVFTNNLFIELDGDKVELVNSYRYLGHIIEFNLSDRKDISNNLNKFYRSTNGIFRNFKMVDKSTLLFLFNSYCKPNYGLQLWNHRSNFRSCIFKTFEVAYSKVFKRILGVSLFSSSHDAAENCNEFLFKHYIALLQYKYYKRLENLNCSILNLNFAYFKRGYFFPFLWYV